MTKKEITFGIDVNERARDAFIDRAMMEQVIQNLLSNCLKHVPVGGEVEISVKTLQFEIPAADDLSTGEELLYRIWTPAAETLEISLTSQSQTAANELYVRYEGLPSSIDHDAAFEGHLWANQTATVPETEIPTTSGLSRFSVGWVSDRTFCHLAPAINDSLR